MLDVNNTLRHLHLCKPAKGVYLSIIVHQKALARFCYFDSRSNGHPNSRVHPNPLPLKIHSTVNTLIQT